MKKTSLLIALISIPFLANCKPKCPHADFTDFKVINNQLYGICPICHEDVLIQDEKLSTFTDKFFMLENKQYIIHDIKDMEDIVNSAPIESNLDIYFVNGEYDLAGFRLDDGITINAHGLLKNDKKTLNATVDCSPIDPSASPQYPREYGNIDFVFDHLMMKGAKRYDIDFHFGLYAKSITYNDCEFTGKQSFYSPKVVCNYCEFNATDFEDKPDYSIYTYSSLSADFNRCNFVSDGKALKIYSDGLSSATYNITDCNFTINEAKSDKAAIQIDSTNVNEYIINITHCHQEGYGGGLYNDTSYHSHVTVVD